MTAVKPGAERFRAPSEPAVDGLAAKLARPRVPPSFVGRARVHEMLDRGTERPLTVISAGAGWGKTLATASWAAAEPAVGPVAWISLDPSDNEPRAFWAFFVRAVRHAVVVPADNPLAELAPGLGNESAGLQRLVAGLEQLPTPVVVVLDDFHLIDDASVLEGVASLLRRPLEQLRLVIVTRSDPPIPLHRLRTADELSEIRTRDLAFDETDAVAMLAADKLDVELDDVQLLVRRTEGWPAGMRLAALFLGRRDQDRSPASFAGDDQAVTDYLVGEVLSSQPPEVQRFLLQTSVAERVSSGLAEALTGEPRAQHHLESLERSNAFVVGLGPGREWFRYHALLREVLQHRLRVDDPAAPADLHRRAAVWFAAHARPLDAMRHAADAEDWSLLGDLFVTHALALTVSADRAAVDRVLARIPRERLADSPALALCAAARLMHAGRFEEMARHLELAAASSPDGSSVTTVAWLLLSTAYLRSTGDIRGARDAAARAIQHLSGVESSLPGADLYLPVALNNLGSALLWEASPAEAAQRLLEALAIIDGTRLDAARINALAHLSLVDAGEGRLRQGASHATEAVELVEARGWEPLPQAATAYLALALIHFRHNEVNEALRRLGHARAAAAHEPAARWAVELAGARMEVSLGRVDEAQQRLAALRSDSTPWQPPAFLERWLLFAHVEHAIARHEPGAAIERLQVSSARAAPSSEEQLCLAQALLAQGDVRAADEVLASLRANDADSGSAVDIWLLTALVADRQREDNRATEALGRALDLARPENVRRPFFEHNRGHVVRLLTLLGQLEPDQDAFARGLLAELQPDVKSTSADVLTEPLTERELVVLRFLPTMMTNSEIAAELFVSVNTVKAHLKRIFRKLGVPSRREAVHRAREIGLLSDTTA